MTVPDPDAYAAAIVSEIRAEMGRKGVTSVRELARMIGINHVSLNDKLGKKRVAMSPQEFYRICVALQVEPRDIVGRATVASGVTPVASHGKLG